MLPLQEMFLTLRACSQIMSATEGGGGGLQNADKADKGGEGVCKMLTMADEGGGGV